MAARDITRVSLLTLGVAWLVCAKVERARAEPELSLSWPEHSGCPDRAWVEQRVAMQLGRTLAQAPRAANAGATADEQNGEASGSERRQSSDANGSAREPATEVRAAIAARTGGGYVLSLRTRRGDERGERTLEGASCEELAEAAALVIALSIEASRPPASAPVRVGTPPASEPQAPSAPARPGAAPVDSSPRFAFRASSLLEGGTLPRVAAGAELALAFSHRRSRAELTGLWLPGVRSAHAEEDDSRVKVALWAVRAGYCHIISHVRRSARVDDLARVRARLGGCVGLELGRVTGEGLDLAIARTEHFRWYAAWLSLRLTIRLVGPLALVVEPALAVPFERRRFVSRDAQGRRVAALHTPGAYSGRAGLGLELAF